MKTDAIALVININIDAVNGMFTNKSNISIPYL